MAWFLTKLRYSFTNILSFGIIYPKFKGVTLKTIIVIDTKLVFYYQQQRHKHPLNCITDIADKVASNIPQDIDKVVWVRDFGKSKRVKSFPQYKAHRKEMLDKKTKAEKARQEIFEGIYKSTPDFLRNFGDVISIPGYEADDLASIIAHRFSSQEDIQVVLVSSDEDWARFLYTDNIALLHYGRNTMIYRRDVEKVFGVPTDHKLFVDSLTGVRKENVDGLVKLGKGRISTLLKELDYDHDKVIETLDRWCEVHKYGARLPEWATCVQNVLARNMRIFTPFTIYDFTTQENLTFNASWSSKTKATRQDILLQSLRDFSVAIQITPNISRIYKIS